jgi:hypothetical protein
MPNRRNNPKNPAVAKPSVDPQPWNKSRMEIEPSPTPETQITPQGRYEDRIKIPSMTEGGAATPRAVRGWPEGLKKT